MTKAQLESKHIAELHELAADAGVERYRMLSRAELIEKLSGEGDAPPRSGGESRGESGRRPRQRDRERGRQARGPREQRERRPKPADAEKRGGTEERRPQPPTAPATTPPPAASRPKRKRRRRRWGRRRKGVRVQDLLLPAAPGRQAIIYAESRAACTALLRETAAELSAASSGPDPIALLIDPTPEELADWKREAPEVEIVSAGKANHADDAVAQARARAEGGEAVILLIDSLSRFAEEFGSAEDAAELFDAGRAGAGPLTVVAALERSA